MICVTQLNWLTFKEKIFHENMYVYVCLGMWVKFVRYEIWLTNYSMVELVDFPKELDHEDMCVTLETH